MTDCDCCSDTYDDNDDDEEEEEKDDDDNNNDDSYHIHFYTFYILISIYLIISPPSRQILPTQCPCLMELQVCVL